MSEYQKFRTRYPGAQPFSDDDLSRRLYFGRANEARALLNQIIANRLVVLYARSGLGKTSLLNAGVAEGLRSEGFFPITVRVNDTKIGPVGSIYTGVEKACQLQQDVVEYIPGSTMSLWHFFKSAQFWGQDILLTPVLILDQFEELFTLHEESDREAFMDQFSCLSRGIRPGGPDEESGKPEVDSAYFNDALLDVKVVISLREDFLAQLEEISDRVPEILDQRCRLKPLTRQAAEEALQYPTTIEDTSLVTHPFKIDAEANTAILDFLSAHAATSGTKPKNVIEPFQLQLLCQYVEEIAQHAQHKDSAHPVILGVSDIGGRPKFRTILKDFYSKQVSSIPSVFQRWDVRKLCTEHLINPQGRRVRMEETEITRLTHVKGATLQKLVDKRLLRRDQSLDGNYFEISHDSLINPIIDTARFWFLVRTCIYILAIAVGLPIIVSMVFPIGGILKGVAIKDIGIEEIGSISVLVILILLLGRWVYGKFRAAVSMWKRYRIK